jgi:hypothetical protein
LRGGNGKELMKEPDDKYVIPKYNEPMNNPMISHEQRRIHNEGKPKDQQPNPNQILNLQLFQPPKPKPPAGKPNPAVFFPNYVPNPFDPMGYANYMQNAQYNMQPIYKDYTINIGGISGSHVKTAVLFEDSLPVKNVSGSFTSISERITMYEVIRSVLFSSGDGTDVPIESDSQNLLSHIKLMDMNPYNASRFSNNPYKGLPFGFLLYRSCYPIRHDARNASAICSTNSTGVNVRIYRLTEGSYMVNRQDITRASDYDEWRDIAFYNYVKEHIIKKKVCPNFTVMYGYNISINSNINFDELKMLQQKVTQTSQARLVKQNGTIRQTDVSQFGRPVGAPDSNRARRVVGVVRDPVTGLVVREITNPPSREDQLIALNRYTGKALVCLSEASNYNILGWAKKEYRSDGNIRTMINSGYHTKSVWESIIFQMLVALYTMQIKGIVINDFKIDRNVFIKDISMGGNVTNYWKYKVEGIEYYIPNYGYLVLIDTNYRDFDKPCPDENSNYESDKKRERKIDGVFIQSCKLTVDQCIEKTFEMFRSAVDPNIFNQDFVKDNGIKPPEEILRLLSNIKNSADSKPTLNIAYYIRQHMTSFLNNRVGGALVDTEPMNVKKGGVKEFRKGQIVVMQDQDGVDKFVVYVKSKDMMARIITKDKINPETANFIEKDVPISSLNEYSMTQPIKQNFNINEPNLNEESLIETYNVE